MTITDQAVVAAANLAERYIADRHLPDKAIDLIDEAGSRLHIKRMDMDVPDELKEIDSKLGEVKKQKDEAVRSEDFVAEADRLSDEEREMMEQRAEFVKNIKASGLDLFDEVDEKSIAEVLSTWTGRQP